MSGRLKQCGLAISLGALLLGPAEPVVAQTEDVYVSPRWAFEIKGGQFYPDLEDYSTFYGSDKTSYLTLTFSYRHRNWLEFGAELGHMEDNGVGVLTISGELGGAVKYTLYPAQIFANFSYDVRRGQLFVPYVGISAVSAYYKQKVDQQPSRDGRTDLGYGVRAGLRLSLNRLDPRAAARNRDRRLKNSFLFIEAQSFSTESDGIDLGGEIYQFGFRFEFDNRQ